MIIIGLTGGIASGKSTVSAYLKQNNIPVIDCDEESRHVLDKGTNGYKLALELFSEDILDENQNINRKKVASIVFEDKSLLQKLNSIIHPEVINKTHELLAKYESEGFDRDNMKMPEGHIRMIEAVANANANTLVVLMCGSAVECP